MTNQAPTPLAPICPSADRVGISGLEVYFSQRYCQQTDLETHDGVSAGKYTIGLGQSGLSFVGDSEDINSVCLTVVQSLMEKYNIDPRDVGRLEVGTETLIDKSKSVKSVLMSLFEESGNSDIEGLDTTNACYGGTSALMNTLNWMESKSWDGRFGIVVAADIAVYAKGPARPTSGIGAVAMLVSPNAPIVFDEGLRATHMEHVYDFYKPDLSSEFPTVDGKLSVACYLRSLDKCYQGYKAKASRRGVPAASLEDFSFLVMHAPYNKLVRKSLGRLAYLDMLDTPETERASKYSEEHLKFANSKPENTYLDRDQERAFIKLAKGTYDEKIAPTTLIPCNIGNTYTASLWCGLASLIAEKSDHELVGKRCMMFSYGSGMAATMLSVRIEGSLSTIRKTMNIHERLNSRVKVTPEEFNRVLDLREKTHLCCPYVPAELDHTVDPGTYYLSAIDEMHRRHYIRKPKASVATTRL